MKQYLESLGYHVSGSKGCITAYEHGNFVIQLYHMYDDIWTLISAGGLRVTLDNIDSVLKMNKIVRDRK